MATYLSDIVVGANVDINFQALTTKGELRNVVLHKDASAPTNPVDGQLWFDNSGGTGNGELKYYDNGSWSAFGTGTGSVSSVGATTLGGLVAGGTASDPTLGIDINNLANWTGTIDSAADEFVMRDATDGTEYKLTIDDMESSFVHDNLSGGGGNIHIDHSTVSVLAGDGMTGGGTITANRTLNVVGGEGIVANANDVALAFTGLTADDSIVIGDVVAYHNGTNHVRTTMGTLRTFMQSGIDLTFGISGNTGTNGTVSTSQTLSVVGTTNQLTTSTAAGQEITIALANDVTIPNDLTVTGDLTVNGTTTTVNTDNLIVEDPLIKLGNGNTADSVDLGVYWQYDATGAVYGGIYRDASDANKAITFFESNSTEPTTTVVGGTPADVKFGSVRAGTWLATDIGVAYGGTGISNPANGGILLGSGTSPVTVLAPAAVGFALLSNGTGTDPVYGQIDLATTIVTGTLPVARGGLGIANPTNNAVLVGSGTGAVTPITVGSNGQFLAGQDGADPSFVTISGAASISNTGDVTLAANQPDITTANSLTSASSLATVGIIGTGTWQGTPITETYISDAHPADGTSTRLPRKFMDDLPAITADTPLTVTHNLGTNDVIVQVYDNTTNDMVFCDIDKNGSGVNNITVTFANSYALDSFRIIIIG